jgi:hypothetical protein
MMGVRAPRAGAALPRLRWHRGAVHERLPVGTTAPSDSRKGKYRVSAKGHDDLNCRIAVIVEWDNVRYHEIQRAKAMLGRVLGQLAEFGPAEILLIFDALAIDQST